MYWGRVQLRECDCRLQDVEAASGRISTASLNSHVQIKCQICISVLSFQAHYAAAGRKRMGGGAVGIQQGMQALMSAWLQGHPMESAQQAGGGRAGDRRRSWCARQWRAGGYTLQGGAGCTLHWCISKHFTKEGMGQTGWPHFIVGETEAWGKEVTDSPSKAFLGVRRRGQHVRATCADRSKL